MNVIEVLVNAMRSGRSPYPWVWTYSETNFAYGNFHYVEIPTVGLTPISVKWAVVKELNDPL